MAAANDKDTIAETDLHRLLRVVRERRWAVMGVMVVAAALYVMWAAKQVRIYQATATVVVEVSPPQVLGGEVRDVVPIGPGQTYYMSDYIQTQRRVLTSDSLVKRVIARLKLEHDSVFWNGGAPAHLEDAVESFASRLVAVAVLDTQLISVSFQHTDPAQAKRAVDGVVDEYIESNLEIRDTSNATASQWLADQADDLRRKLAERELAVYEFKRKNDLLSVSLEDRQNNVSRQIDKFADALTDIRLRKVARSAEAEELAKLAESDGGAVRLHEIMGPIGEIKRQIIEEDRRLSELRARYEDAHPLVKQQAAKVQGLQAAMHREVALEVRSAQSQTEEAAAQERKIAGQLETAKQEGLRITRLEVEFNKLKRDVDAVSKQYVLVQNRTKEAELASKVKGNNLRVLDYARLPRTPVSPNLRRAAVSAVTMALLVGLALAFLLDALDRSVKTQLDVENKLGFPFLGMIPRATGGPTSDRIVADNPSSQTAECCRLIRTNLMFAGLTRPLRRLLVTSPIPREGKTLTSVSLGIVMAQAGQKVLLVDADLRRPRLATALGVNAPSGLTNVLLGSIPLEDAIVPTGIPGLSLLAAGPVPPNPAELIDGVRFREILDECNEKFERVLIDSPPAVPVTDPALLAARCDGVVLVLRSGRSAVQQAQRAARSLIDVGGRLIGVVLNDCDLARGEYGSYSYKYVEGTKSRIGKRARG